MTGDGPWSLFLFDPEDRRWRRPWHEMLPAGFHEVEIQRGRFHHPDRAVENGVVLVHASQLPPERQQRALFRAAAAANLHLILLSGGHQDATAESETVHVRRTPVRPRQADAVFTTCFRRFWDHRARTGTPCFALLEPAQDPLQALAILCQGYLLAHVPPGTTRVRFPDTDLRSAKQADQALARLGLAPEMLPSEDAADQERRAAEVRSPEWWSCLGEAIPAGSEPRDAGEPAAVGEPSAVTRLLSCLRKQETMSADLVVPAYLELEERLRAAAH